MKLWQIVGLTLIVASAFLVMDSESKQEWNAARTSAPSEVISRKGSPNERIPFSSAYPVGRVRWRLRLRARAKKAKRSMDAVTEAKSRINWPVVR